MRVLPHKPIGRGLSELTSIELKSILDGLTCLSGLEGCDASTRSHDAVSVVREVVAPDIASTTSAGSIFHGAFNRTGALSSELDIVICRGRAIKEANVQIELLGKKYDFWINEQLPRTGYWMGVVRVVNIDEGGML